MGNEVFKDLERHQDDMANARSNLLSPLLYFSENNSVLNQSLDEEVQDSLPVPGSSILANDLSDLISLNLDELATVAESTTPHYSTPDGIMLSSPPFDSERIFQTNVPMSYISLSGLNHFYMKEFYNDFSKIILPLQAKENGVTCNPVRDILMIHARDSYYLLYALLACGARTSHRKTSLPEDLSSYKAYLRHCLTSLTTAMDQQFNSKLDSILLTILVLTCDNASNKSQAWRAHLHGAKDLLFKKSYTNQKPQSMTFLLCRAWYSSIEILAGLVSANGGTLQSNEELDLLTLPNDQKEAATLRELKIVSPEGVSLFHGYSMELVVALKDLIKLLRNENKSRVHYSKIIDLLARLNKQLSFQVISGAGIIPETHQYHPKNVRQDNLNHANIEIISIDGNKIAVSWLDIVHRSYTLASLITISTKLLNMKKECEMVQGMVRDLLDTAFFLDATNDSSKSYCSFLLQWPILVAGLNSIEEPDKIKVETFFRLLAELGSGSAGFVLVRMRKVWLKGLKFEQETPDQVDIVPY